MTDLKTMDHRIEKLQGQLQRLQNRRQRVKLREDKTMERSRRQLESERRTLAGEILLAAMARGEMSVTTLERWCNAAALDAPQRTIIGL
ncbi:MAG: hypothetical protein WCP04_13315 [Pseudomonadota bacterium]|jgi:hypothetical protein